MLVDTHCHLDLLIKNGVNSPAVDKNIQKAQTVLDDAENSGVSKIVTIGIDYPTSVISCELTRLFQNVSCSVGVHPCDLTRSWKDDLKKIEILLQNHQEKKIVGIGETGLDFYHPGFDKERQKNGFRAHIELALTYQLPLIIHTRNAIDETLAILQEYHKDRLQGVFHCFTHDQNIADECIRLNFLLGIGGIITYPKNEYLRTIVKNDQLHHCILETDAPFLPPQAIRGQRNTPAQIKTIAEYIAQLLQTDLEQVAATTTTNAENLFKI